MQKSNEKKILGTVPKNYQILENFWDCPEFSRKQQNQKGITLIALIITMIVMLILVGVTINVALNGGLFEKAQQAVVQTNIEKDKEILQNIALGFLGTNGEISFSEFETEYTGKTVEGYTIKSEEEYASATKGETIFYITKYGGVSEEKPTEKVYTFTLNELKEEGYTFLDGDETGIQFNADYLWNSVIKEDLSNNEKYALNIDDETKLFAIESTNGFFANMVEFIFGMTISDPVQYMVGGAIYIDATGEFNFMVYIPDSDYDAGYKKLLVDSDPEEGEMTVEEFLDEYGDVEFRFVDVSLIEIPSDE